MKPRLQNQLSSVLIAIMAALCGPSAADPTYTFPVGYETLRGHGHSFNLFAMRLHQPVLRLQQGNELLTKFETVSGSLLTDNDVDFGSALGSLTPCIIELIGGPVDGMVLNIVSFSGHTLTVAESLPDGSDVSYQIRAASRLSETIRPGDMLAVPDFNPDHGDLILIPSGGGQFNQYYASSRIGYTGFFNVATGLPEDPYLHYNQAFFYLRREASDLDFIFVGEVKMRNTLLSVTDTFNYFGSVNPVLTLGGIGLELSIPSGTADTADIVWLQDSTGQYTRYFYSDGTPPMGVGWRRIDVPSSYDDSDQSGVEITSGIIVQRRGALPYNILLRPPYASL